MINYNLRQLQKLSSNNILPQAILLSSNGYSNLSQSFKIATDFAKWLFCDFKSSALACVCPACKVFVANNHPDYLLINLTEEQEIKIEMIRAANNFINTAPYLANRKILLINNFHNINQQAANAFLKTLEEPPLTTDPLFLLITNKSRALPATILSRVLQLNILEQVDNQQPEILPEILQDLYNIWVQDSGNFIEIINKWQLLPKQQLINCLWSIMSKIIKAVDPSMLLEIKQKISPKLAWQLLDSLHYINKQIILDHQINWQLFLYNFIMTKLAGENIYVARRKS